MKFVAMLLADSKNSLNEELKGGANFDLGIHNNDSKDAFSVNIPHQSKLFLGDAEGYSNDIYIEDSFVFNFDKNDNMWKAYAIINAPSLMRLFDCVASSNTLSSKVNIMIYNQID
jgi:hypothetical protein